MTRLPIEALSRFGGKVCAGPGFYTDGKNLILEGAVVLGDVKHDLRVSFYGPKGEEVALPRVLRDSLDYAAQQAKELFPEMGIRSVTYISNKSEKGESCTLEREGGTEILGLSDKVTKAAQKIFEAFCPERQATCSLNGTDPTVSPEMISASNAFENRAKDRTASHAIQVRRKPMQPSDEVGLPAALKVSSFPNMEQAFDAALTAKKETFSSFLQGVSYTGLAEYASLENKPKESPFQKAYEALLKITKDPTCQEEDAAEMKKWLELLYAVAYFRYPALRSCYDKEKRDKTTDLEFGPWCEQYAAHHVLGFIYQPQAIGPLAQELQKVNVTFFKEFSSDN